MDKFITTNNIFSYKIKSAEQPRLLTEVEVSYIWEYSLALCKTSAVHSQSSVSSGHECERGECADGSAGWLLADA